MDRDGFSRLPRCMRGFCSKTLREISVSKPGKKKTKYCAKGSHASTITAVEFDKVQAKLYAPMLGRTLHLPASVDALYYSGNMIYGIEFKTGSVNHTEIVRKIYDSAICLVEHCKGKLTQLRESFEVIVVASKLEIMHEEAQRNTKARHGTANVVIGRSRKFQVFQRIGEGATSLWGLDKIEGVIVHRVYTISPEDFEEFCMRHDWM